MGNSTYGIRGQQNRMGRKGEKVIFRPDLNKPEEQPDTNALVLNKTGETYNFGDIQVQDFSGKFPKDFQKNSLFRIHVLGRHINMDFRGEEYKAEAEYTAMIPAQIVEQHEEQQKQKKQMI